MLLTLDIGNTKAALGLFDGETLAHHQRFPATVSQDADALYTRLAEYIGIAGIDKKDIMAAMVSSVVPAMETMTREALERLAGPRVYFLGTEVAPPMPVLTENPSEVGADRLANAIAAYHLKRSAVIVVDMGTAITVDLVTEAGEFAGGAIAPGPGIAAEALSEHTAQLPHIDLERPVNVIGRSTGESMKSGLYFGFCGLVEGLIKGLRQESGTGAEVIATGGLAELLAPGCDDIRGIDQFLTLKGLNIIYNEVF